MPAKKQLRLQIPVRFAKLPEVAVAVPIKLKHSAPLDGLPWRPTISQLRALRFL